jgi:hypothetical protein
MMMMSNFPTLEDAAAIVRPHNEQLLKDLRYSAFLEDVRRIASETADKHIRLQLRRAIRKVEE